MTEPHEPTPKGPMSSSDFLDAIRKASGKELDPYGTGRLRSVPETGLDVVANKVQLAQTGETVEIALESIDDAAKHIFAQLIEMDEEDFKDEKGIQMLRDIFYLGLELENLALAEDVLHAYVDKADFLMGEDIHLYRYLLDAYRAKGDTQKVEKISQEMKDIPLPQHNKDSRMSCELELALAFDDIEAGELIYRQVMDKANSAEHSTDALLSVCTGLEELLLRHNKLEEVAKIAKVFALENQATISEEIYGELIAIDPKYIEELEDTIADMSNELDNPAVEDMKYRLAIEYQRHGYDTPEARHACLLVEDDFVERGTEVSYFIEGYLTVIVERGRLRSARNKMKRFNANYFAGELYKLTKDPEDLAHAIQICQTTQVDSGQRMEIMRTLALITHQPREINAFSNLLRQRFGDDEFSYHCERFEVTHAREDMEAFLALAPGEDLQLQLIKFSDIVTELKKEAANA